MRHRWRQRKDRNGMFGAALWIGGILAIVVGAALLYSSIIGQIAQALR